MRSNLSSITKKVSSDTRKSCQMRCQSLSRKQVIQGICKQHLGTLHPLFQQPKTLTFCKAGLWVQRLLRLQLHRINPISWGSNINCAPLWGAQRLGFHVNLLYWQRVRWRKPTHSYTPIRGESVTRWTQPSELVIPVSPHSHVCHNCNPYSGDLAEKIAHRVGLFKSWPGHCHMQHRSNVPTGFGY